METLSFALGAASVGVLLIVVALIWVLLRVKEIVKEQNNMIESLLNIDRTLSQRMDNSEHHFSDEINKVHDTIHHRLDEVYRVVDNNMGNQRRVLDDLHRESISYTDSRIDKLINNPKFCLNKEKELLTD